MRILLPTILFLSCFAVQSSAQETINATLMHDGIEREYILYVPASYDPATPMPLVLSFHGYSSNAQVNFAYTNFSGIADEEGFLVIHPQGTLLNGTPHWNVGGWTLGSNTDDVGFVDALLDEMMANYNINPDRVYSTGMSNGGYMSFLLACQLSDRIAAIASVTGSMTPQTLSACSPQHPTPVLQIHGTNDGTVPYNGDPSWTYSIEQVLQYWVDYNNCESTAQVSNVADSAPNDGSTAQHFLYANGDNGVTTEHFKITGGDHDWPGVWGNMDINASREVWDFFNRFDINGAMAPVSNTSPEEAPTPRVFPNPAKQLARVELATQQESPYSIYSLAGKLLQQGSLQAGGGDIDLTELPLGVYFLKVGGQTVKLVKAG